MTDDNELCISDCLHQEGTIFMTICVFSRIIQILLVGTS